jgi:energy-converting hydrogenase Eha subunit A
MAMFQPQAIAPDQPIEFDITGTRMIGRHAIPRASLGLVAGSVADHVVSRRGHLSVLKGGQSEG